MNRTLSLFLLFLIIGCSKPTAPKADSGIDYWTCTMHPSVHSPDPGKCPICSMDLVPVMKKGAVTESPADGFTVPVERQQQIGVTYATLEKRELSRSVRALGQVEPDKKRVWSFVARTEGYVEKLFVASPGEFVEKGAPLLSLYSPELLTTQQEFAMLVKQNSSNLAEASRSRLRRWNVSDAQIAALGRGGKPSESITFQSPFRGVVTGVSANQGANVKVGDPLVEVADLSVVWVWAEVYETEIQDLKPDQKVAVTASAFPNRKFEGTIRLIDPSVDPVKRTARARIDVDNADFALMPGMDVDAMLTVDGGDRLSIPVDAVLPTGMRNLVFVDKGNGRLEPRAITVDGKFGDDYAVKSGVGAGERVVASANFLIDAEAKVQGALNDFQREEPARSMAPR